MFATHPHHHHLTAHGIPVLGDTVDRRCLITSAALHGCAVILIMGWHVILAWLPAAKEDEAHKDPPPSPPRPGGVYAAGAAPAPQAARPTLPQALDPDDTSDPLRPRLDSSHEIGSGDGHSRNHGLAIDLPELPAQFAIPQETKQSSEGGGRRNLPQQLRREQEANYLLMGFLLRQYQGQWKPIYGHRLVRGPIRLWIEHDNSRVTSAAFARGSSTGVPELDRHILAWLVEDNKIDLSDLRGSERRLLMSVDLYQAHR
ncbi:MAG: hypothetical protein EA401_03725 [Planctomycetota bacterium]|nr:MAG: hypothetical protein EA401_03725 [Planctomycetota bacterium]